MPILRRQPFKGLYVGASYLQLFTLRIPYWIFRYLLRSRRPRASWSLMRCIHVELVRWGNALVTRVGMGHMQDYTKLETDAGKGIEGVWIPPATELVYGEMKKWTDAAEVSSVRIPGYWYTKSGSGKLPLSAAPVSDTEKVLLFFHGGGYMALSAHPSFVVNENIRYLLEHTNTATRALSVEYRLAKPGKPETAFPTPIVDGIASYKYIVDTVGFKPQNIILVGDSAGGNLALALARYCVQYSSQLDGLPAAPGALVLFSPWVDLTASHAKNPDASPYKNASTDFITHPTPSDPISFSARTYAGPHDLSILTHPYVSPACLEVDPVFTATPATFTGFPKTFIMYGGAEVLMDSIITVVERIKRDVGEENVRVHVAKDAFHDCVPFKFFEPERTDIVKAAGKFIDEL